MRTKHQGSASEYPRRSATLFRRLGFGLGLVLLLGFFAMPQASQAQTSDTLVANIGKTPNSLFYSVRTYEFAQAFTTGANAGGYRLTSVEIPLNVATGNAALPEFSIEIWSDSSGAPGSSLLTLTKPATLATGKRPRQFNAPTNGFALDASTTYHVVWDLPPGQGQKRNVSAGFTSSDAQDDGSLEGWSIADDSHYRNNGIAQWTSFDRSMRIAVNGYAPMASDPDLTLSALGLEYLDSTSNFASLALSPAFDSDTGDYTASLTRSSRGTGTAQFTATANNSSDAGEIKLFKGDEDLGAFGDSSTKTTQYQDGLNEYRIVVSNSDGSHTRTYRVSLQVSLDESPTVSLVPRTSNIAPGRYLNLKAVASDPDGGEIQSYAWTVRNSSNANVTDSVLVGATDTAEVVFVTENTGTYGVSISVTDDEGNTASVNVSPSVTVAEPPPDPNNPPTVAIDQNGPLYVTAGTNLDLSATAEDSDGSIASYAWSARTFADGRSGNSVTDAVLRNATSTTPTFNTSDTGEYHIVVLVHDDDGAWASAGPLVVHVTRVEASSDASLRGLSVSFGHPRKRPLVLVPAFSRTTYEYTVVEPAWNSNTRPNWVNRNYGIHTTVPTFALGLNVTATVNDSGASLSGVSPRNSNDAEPYEHTMASGVEESMPLVAGDNALTITVTAEDGTMRDYTLNVRRAKSGTSQPEATITGGANQPVAVNTDLTLDGSGSSDPDGGALIGYAWYVMGPGGRNFTSAVLGSARPNTSTVTFNAPAAGLYAVILMAFDDDGDVGYEMRDVLVTE